MTLIDKGSFWLKIINFISNPLPSFERVQSFPRSIQYVIGVAIWHDFYMPYTILFSVNIYEIIIDWLHFYNFLHPPSKNSRFYGDSIKLTLISFRFHVFWETGKWKWKRKFIYACLTFWVKTIIFILLIEEEFFFIFNYQKRQELNHMLYLIDRLMIKKLRCWNIFYSTFNLSDEMYILHILQHITSFFLLLFVSIDVQF